jgi:photosystem II stability/assembly factor-like uncharacterized protein
MKKILYIIPFLIITSVYAQDLHLNKNSDLYKTAPEWAKLMYEPNPNCNEVDKLYEAYFKITKYEKTYHTQYYKRWRRAINPFLNNSGFVDSNKKVGMQGVIDKLRKHQEENKKTRSGNWTPLGPFKNVKEGGVIGSGAHANVYTIGRCEALPNIMYCGTEPGEVYKSIDGGDNWENASKTLVTAYTPDAVTANAGIQALAVHPTNGNIVYVGSGSQVYKTINGGTSWSSVFNSNISLGGYVENPAELHIISNNPQIVLVAGKEGIYRTANGGTTWAQVLTDACFDIKAKPGNPNTLYTVRKNVTTNTQQFLISTNAGVTWVPQSTGWYTSSDPARYVEGARIAVSQADSNRVYAFLIGGSKTGDNGFIGLYKSTNGGISWVNTMGYDGSPYIDSLHPNLISNQATSFSGSYNQGFYNCAIMASNTNANDVLVGGIGMWRSTDAGLTFSCIYNYSCGSFNPMHVDQQDYRAFGNDYWATTDGGIYKSNDLFVTQPLFKMNGVNAVDFWGFGSGWNTDVLIGGTFHNGVDAYQEGYPAGEFLNLVDGEPASGYVNPGAPSRVYSSGMGSRLLPANINGTILNAPFDADINETAWFAESSELEFHPSCYNHIYKGYKDKLYKSIDGGANFTTVYTAVANSQVLGIEASRSNTNTMYIVIRPAAGDGYLIKTTDDWATNSTITLPTPGNNLAIISIDAENDQIIWVAYPRGNDGNKIYKSTDGGVNWVNQTSTELDAQDIQAMVAIGGTNGGVYVATNVSAYYKNNTMTSWAIDNINLPTSIGATGIRPFYRDGKIRMASYGKGIWESALYDKPARPLAKIMADKLSAELNCNVFQFDDYSMLNHTNATWNWTFQHANITASTLRNPQVTFNTLGSHMVTLTVKDANNISATDTLFVTTVNTIGASINHNFEVQFLPQNWKSSSNYYANWTYNDSIGGFGLSTKCMSFNNFVVNNPGFFSDVTVPVDMQNTSPANAVLSFDVAYAMYAINYADTLQVLISTDCGATYKIVYAKGGDALGTAPAQNQSQFVPSSTEWRKDSVNLSTYIGNSNVLIKFRNINMFGQPIYVDNINMIGSIVGISNPIISDENIVYPNPISTSGSIIVKGTDNSEIELNLYNLEGKLIDKIFTKLNTAIPMGKYNLSQGIYLYEMFSNNKISKGKIVIADRY